MLWELGLYGVWGPQWKVARGGRVQTTLSVNPGDTLNINVGGRGMRFDHNSWNSHPRSQGGWNGGGDGEYCPLQV